MQPSNVADQPLSSLMNVGKATLHDLSILEIHSIEELAKQDSSELYQRLQIAVGKKIDPCMWDVFHAIIHEAKTGEKTTWWSWTPMRKKIQESGKFPEFIC